MHITLFVILIFDSSKFNFDNLLLYAVVKVLSSKLNLLASILITQNFCFSIGFSSPQKFRLSVCYFRGPRASRQRRSVFMPPLSQSDEAILPHPFKACQQLFLKILNFFALFLIFFTKIANTRHGVSVFARFLTKFCPNFL